MRRDVTELKKLVHDIMNGKIHTEVPAHYLQNQVSIVRDPSVVVSTPVSEMNTSLSSVSPIEPIKVTHVESPGVQDTEEYVEENLSLDDVEKEMIRKALERHHGKRKNAAQDLKISERTLYRKIKEYGLD